MKFGTIFVSFLAVALLAVSPTQAKQPLFPKIVVFGESTSDIGNVWLLTGQEIGDPGTWDPSNFDSLPTEPVPPLYDYGRWSNGPMWVELLSKKLARGRMRPSLENGLNYAFADARAGNGIGDLGYDVRFSVWSGAPLVQEDGQLDSPVPAVGTQIEMHAAKKGSIRPKHLVVLWVGANDIFAQVLFGESESVANAVDAIAEHVHRLVKLGAKHILVPDQIDASGAPFFFNVPPNIRTGISDATVLFNSLLANKLNALAATVADDDVTLYRLKFSLVAVDLFASCVPSTQLDCETPAALVYLSQARDPESGEPGPFAIDDALFDNFVFWDTIHPTRAMHARLAEAAVAFCFSGVETPLCPSW